MYAVETKDGWRPVREPLTWDLQRNHLEGLITLGTYPVQQGSTKFVVFDVDTLDPMPLLQLTSVLTVPHVVEYTGGRGNHVWVLFPTWVSAAKARAWAHRMLELSGAQHVEVFPKQDSVEGDTLGNLIRVPLGLHKLGQRSRILHDDRDFCDPSELENGVDGVIYNRGAQQERGQEEWIAALFDGDVSAKQGRNNSLRALFYWLTNRGVPAEVAGGWVREANTYLSPPLDEEELNRTVLREVV